MQHRSMTWKNIEDNSKVEDVKNGFIVDTSCESVVIPRVCFVFEEEFVILRYLQDLLREMC